MFALSVKLTEFCILYRFHSTIIVVLSSLCHFPSCKCLPFFLCKSKHLRFFFFFFFAVCSERGHMNFKTKWTGERAKEANDLDGMILFSTWNNKRKYKAWWKPYGSFSVKCAKNIAKKRTHTLTYMAIRWLMCTVHCTTQSHGNDDAFHSLYAAVINQGKTKQKNKAINTRKIWQMKCTLRRLDGHF